MENFIKINEPIEKAMPIYFGLIKYYKQKKSFNEWLHSIPNECLDKKAFKKYDWNHTEKLKAEDKIKNMTHNDFFISALYMSGIWNNCLSDNWQIGPINLDQIADAQRQFAVILIMEKLRRLEILDIDYLGDGWLAGELNITQKYLERLHQVDLNKAEEDIILPIIKNVYKKTFNTSIKDQLAKDGCECAFSDEELNSEFIQSYIDNFAETKIKDAFNKKED
ncbi:MAG: hypothetical protein ABR980_12765 [Ignavibacteriaceae bacterium]